MNVTQRELLLVNDANILSVIKISRVARSVSCLRCSASGGMSANLL